MVNDMTVSDLTNVHMTVNADGHLIYTGDEAVDMDFEIDSDGHLIAKINTTYDYGLYLTEDGELIAIDIGSQVWDGSRDASGRYVGNYFTYMDFNRLGAKIETCGDMMGEKYDKVFTLPKFVSKSVSEVLYADEFNTLVQNLATVANGTDGAFSYSGRTYRVNGSTPKASELNVIEALLDAMIADYRGE